MQLQFQPKQKSESDYQKWDDHIFIQFILNNCYGHLSKRATSLSNEFSFVYSNAQNIMSFRIL